MRGVLLEKVRATVTNNKRFEESSNRSNFYCLLCTSKAYHELVKSSPIITLIGLSTNSLSERLKFILSGLLFVVDDR